jgi:hypothetical protein
MPNQVLMGDMHRWRQYCNLYFLHVRRAVGYLKVTAYSTVHFTIGMGYGAWTACGVALIRHKILAPVGRRRATCDSYIYCRVELRYSIEES